MLKVVEAEAVETEKKKIGAVFVDTGTLVVCDPCRLATDEDWRKGNLWFDRTMMYPNNDGMQFGKGDCVLFSTGWGDGWYDVVATFKEVGAAENCVPHKRIAKIEITFIGDDEEDATEEHR